MCEGALNKPSSTALTVLNSLSGMASIGGNLLILLTIYKQPRLHTISNCFIASLAVADIIVGLVINPIWATRSAMNIWEEKEPLTIASECLAAHTVVATSLNLCAVSIDRYLAVVKVFRYDTSLSERRCRIIICSIWLAACLALLPRALIQDRLDLQKSWIVGCTITFFIPLCVIAYSYVHISGADPGFFLGGGTPVSCSTSTPINHMFFFWQNTSCIRKPQVISGRGGAHPLHPPPRSAPAFLR